MNTLKTIQKTRDYLDYLERHIKLINFAWEIVQDACTDMRFISDKQFRDQLNYAIEVHDMSKLSEEEFVSYRKKFFPAHEGEMMHNMKDAWTHHKACNSHHWETWTNLNPSFHVDDWEIHCAHMVIDWMAMGYNFSDPAREYYERHKEDIKLPERAIAFIYEIFERVEYYEATSVYIKKKRKVSNQ